MPSHQLSTKDGLAGCRDLGERFIELLRHAVFIFPGQAGTTVKGAYDVLVSMSIISYFIPYLLMFASMIRLQREPAGRKSFGFPEVVRPQSLLPAWALPPLSYRSFLR